MKMYGESIYKKDKPSTEELILIIQVKLQQYKDIQFW